MKDATLAAIQLEIGRLRDQLDTTPLAVAILLVGDKAYFAIKAKDETTARWYLGTALTRLFVQGGLTEIEDA